MTDLDKEEFIVIFENTQIAHAQVMRANGFYDGRPKDVTAKLAMFMLMVTELAEGAEGIRKDKNDDHLPHYKMETVELADTILRIMDYATFHGLPVARALTEKLQYNASRPYRHGDKKA